VRETNVTPSEPRYNNSFSFINLMLSLYSDWLDGRGPILHKIPTGTGAQPASVAISLGVKRLERESEHPPTSSTEISNGGAIPLLPYTPS
jgi:hypothetical protein